MKTCNWETDVICATLVLYMWVGPRNCGCLVAWICYQLMANPGSRTAAVPWPDPYVFTVYMTHRLSVYILYGHINGTLILVTSYLHIHFSYVHECILTALYCAVFVLLMHVFIWLSLLLLLYIVRNDENKDDQSINQLWFVHHQAVTWIDKAILLIGHLGKTTVKLENKNRKCFIQKAFENDWKVPKV